MKYTFLEVSLSKWNAAKNKISIMSPFYIFSIILYCLCFFLLHSPQTQAA